MVMSLSVTSLIKSRSFFSLSLSLSISLFFFCRSPLAAGRNDSSRVTRKSPSSADSQIAQRDLWCRDPKNYLDYKKMVNDYNLQNSCMWMSEQQCALVVGVTAVGGSVGARSAGNSFLKSRTQLPSITCQISHYFFENEFFHALFRWVGWNVAEAAQGLGCRMSPTEQARLVRLAREGANHYETQLNRASQVVKEAEGLTKFTQAEIKEEIDKIRQRLGGSAANRLGLNTVESHLSREIQSTQAGWNPFLRERAQRLREEYTQALSSGNANQMRVAGMELRLFMGANFDEGVLRQAGGANWVEKLKSIEKGLATDMKFLEGLVGSSSDTFSTRQISEWCFMHRGQCSGELNKLMELHARQMEELTQASRRANVLQVRHHYLLSIAEDSARLGPNLSPQQARELLLRFTENVDPRFFSSNDYRHLARVMGYDFDDLRRHNVTTQAIKGVGLKAGAGSISEVEKVYASPTARNIFMSGLKPAGKVTGMAGKAMVGLSSVLSGPLLATELALGDVFYSPETCDGSAPHSVYVNANGHCQTLVEFTEGLGAFLELPLEEQLEHLKSFPEVCDVLRKTLPHVGSQRWQVIECKKNADNELVGISSHLQGDSSIQMTWQTSAKSAGGTMKVFSSARTPRSQQIPRGAWEVSLNEYGQFDKMRLPRAPLQTMNRNRVKAMKLEDPAFYQEYDPATYIFPGTFDFAWQTLEGRKERDVAVAVTQMRANRMAVVKIKSCCVQFTEECRDYGFKGTAHSGGSSQGSTSNDVVN